MVVVRGRCRHRRMPRSVVAIVFAPSMIVSSATDSPRLPSPWSSPTIGASGKPWTTTTTARPCRASRTSTASRRLLRARRPCSSPSSLLSSSSPRNAFPKIGGGRPPRNRTPTPRYHVGVVVILRCDTTAVIAFPILPPIEQHAKVDPRHRRRHGRRTPPPPRRGAVVATIERRRIPSARRRGRRPGGVGDQRRRIRCTPPPPTLPTPPLTRYRGKS